MMAVVDPGNVVAAAGEPLELVPYETEGWHGSTPEGADSILEGGFDLGRCADGWLGKGVYFYENWEGATMTCHEAAELFVKTHRGCPEPSVLKASLKFKKFFSIERNHCKFYKNVRTFIIDRLSDEELEDVGAKIENFVIKCIDQCFPVFQDRDGIGKCFDGTPVAGMSHAMVIVHDTSCIADLALVS